MFSLHPKLPRCPFSLPIGFVTALFLFSHSLLFPLPTFGQEAAPSPPPESFLTLGIGFYQKILAPLLASECIMSPSCSRYSRQAFTRYGPFLGLLLTVDRLFHEADEARTSPLIREGETWKLFDPPEANIFWK